MDKEQRGPILPNRRAVIRRKARVLGERVRQNSKVPVQCNAGWNVQITVDPHCKREHKEAGWQSCLSFVTFSRHILANGTLAPTGAYPAKFVHWTAQTNLSLPDNVPFLGRATNCSYCKRQSPFCPLFFRKHQTFFVCKTKHRKSVRRNHVLDKM